MSDSVQKDGTVRGPAPQGKNPDVISLSAARNANNRQAAGYEKAVSSKDNNGKEPELSIAVARASLSNALKSQRHLEARLDKICSSMLIAGEQIPALDQDEFSMLQEAYINASMAASIATEKALLWRAKVNRLSARARSASGPDDFPLAA